ncbi:MAG: hypothetical protein H0W65_07695 [Sphingomonas sp.]|uniref:hypothetical protein n=1 Tax=Sphingomonas sp. TaxID=28214 RepID=UPI0017ED3A40|nr:hypothetical protein [Sphingomonas sp.]MBA3667589.1 hypothetical protein [Sphingomonas sp.]
MSKHQRPDLDNYVPVELRHRQDGWTPARQVDFLLALSETACVDEACRAVGMSPSSAYALRRRIEAASFRAAWDMALDYGVSRLADAALSRAINGVARPVFYKGELIGERRYYDERLTMFLLRLRDPVRFGAWRDRTPFEQDADAHAKLAERSVEAAEREAALNACQHIGFDDPDGDVA